jgi:hypothetical protein
MKNRAILRRALTLLIGAGFVAAAGTSFAMDFGNMMNPSKWMGGGRDRDRGDYWGGPGYGYGGPGYGWGGPGYGYGGPGYGWGGPGYGWGGPGYGYGYGAPGYGYGGPRYGVPAPGAGGDQAEIEALKQRMNQLEQGQVK